MFGDYGLLSDFHKESKAELAQQLESQFNSYYMFGHIKEAYETFGKMMEYSLIGTDDSRLDPKGHFLKAVVKGKIATEDHRFPYDMRKDKYSLGQWIYCPLPRAVKYTVNSREYWGKRVEGNYEGDMVYPARTHELTIRLDNTAKQSENSMEMINNTYKEEYGKGPITADDIKLAREGIIRTYVIEFDSPILARYKTLGHVVLAPTDDGIRALLIIKNDILKRYFIDVNRAYTNAINALKTRGLQGKVKFMGYCKLDEHIAEQKKLIQKQYELNDKIEEGVEKSVAKVK